MSTFEFVHPKWSNDPNRYQVLIRDAKLRFKNFSGRGNDTNREGNRCFAVVIDNIDFYNELVARGWNLSTWEKGGMHPEPFSEMEDGSVCLPFTNVNLNFHGNFPPTVIEYTKENVRGRKVPEAEVGELDMSYLENVKLLLNPSHWKTASGEGTKGYVEELRCTIDNGSPFDDDPEYQFEDEAIPFDEADMY